ncbi:MAG: type II toxin-antitoxin system prevent-host-death family antitoxin [Solirubrobacteraceae bacterium]
MGNVTIRELRNRGGEVVDRAARGETITITRSGRPVAELHGLPRAAQSAEVLVERWKQLPAMDPVRLPRAASDVLQHRCDAPAGNPPRERTTR